jgi:hypothetical protein
MMAYKGPLKIASRFDCRLAHLTHFYAGVRLCVQAEEEARKQQEAAAQKKTKKSKKGKKKSKSKSTADKAAKDEL